MPNLKDSSDAHIVQVAAAIVRLNGGTIGTRKLWSIMYLVDRSNLDIIGDRLSGTEFSVTPSGLRPNIPDNRFIKTSGRFTTLVEDPGNDELSEHDDTELEKACKHYKSFTEEQLVRMVKSFPEAIRPAGYVISREDILLARGYLEHDVNEILEPIRHVEAIDRMLGNTP